MLWDALNTVNPAEMPVLVTGGAGYIGSHIVHCLKTAGYPVVVYDRFSTGFRALTAMTQPRAVVEGSLHDEVHLAETLTAFNIKAVVHCAASCYVGDSVHRPAEYYDNNVVGTHHLLNAMATAGVEALIFSSTCAVYGQPEVTPLNETLPLAPISPYGFTKRVVEAMLTDRSHAATLGTSAPLRYVSLRYFNAAGATPNVSIGEAHDPETHLIPLVLQVATGERPHITVYGTDYPTPDGTCVRDYVHVDDLAAAHELALRYVLSGGPSEIFNLGSEHGASVRQVIDACRKVTGHAIPEVQGTRREGDPPFLVASAAKIKARLGWEPQYTDIVKTIETAWQWEQVKQRVLGQGTSVSSVAHAGAN